MRIKTDGHDQSDQTKIDKIIAALDIKIKPADLKSKDTRNLLLAVFAQWLPLPSAAFRAIIDQIPPPPEAQSARIPRLLHPEFGFDAPLEPGTPLERDLYAANDSDKAHTVAYISKMFAVQTKDLPEHQRRQMTADDLRAKAKAVREARERRKRLEAAQANGDANGIALEEANAANEEAKDDEEPEAIEGETLLGFARLLSGNVKVGETLYAVLPRYVASLPPSSRANAKHLATVQIKGLYMMMGKELVAVEKASAGHLCAISGLEGVVLRNATLCKMGDREPKASPADADDDRGALINLAGVESAVASLALAPNRHDCTDLVGLGCTHRQGGTRASRAVRNAKAGRRVEVARPSRSLRRDARPRNGRARHLDRWRAPSRAVPQRPARPLLQNRDHRLASDRAVPRDGRQRC